MILTWEWNLTWRKAPRRPAVHWSSAGYREQDRARTRPPDYHDTTPRPRDLWHNMQTHTVQMDSSSWTACVFVIVTQVMKWGQQTITKTFKSFTPRTITIKISITITTLASTPTHNTNLFIIRERCSFPFCHFKCSSILKPDGWKSWQLWTIVK